MTPAPNTPAADALPALAVALSPDEVLRRADALARRGKLPGFAPGTAGVLFTATAFGTPFDHALLAESSAAGPMTAIRFRLKMLPRTPLIVAIVIALSIWPGVWLTDSMLRTYFDWYRLTLWQTCLWYLPLTVLPLPWWLAKSLRKSRAEARSEATELIERLRAALGA